VSAAAQFALVPVVPVYARRFGLSGFEQGMLLGATGLATLIVSVPAGAMSDRFGPRRVTLAASAGQASAGQHGAGQHGAGQHGLGASIGLLNLIWAATAVLGPLAAGLAAEHLGPGAAFGLTQAACVVALAVTATMTWRGRRRGRGCEILTRCTCCPRTGPITGSSTPNGSARPSRPWTARR
jgi:MFS family permease